MNLIPKIAEMLGVEIGEKFYIGSEEKIEGDECTLGSPCPHQKPPTNEEWLRSCTTEQLVHVIHLMTTSCFVCGKDGVDYKRCYFHKKCTGPKEIEEWLKEPHNSFE